MKQTTNNTTTCHDCGKEISGRVEVCISILDGVVRCTDCAKQFEEEGKDEL